jgi:hypothetical protein
MSFATLSARGRPVAWPVMADTPWLGDTCSRDCSHVTRSVPYDLGVASRVKRSDVLGSPAAGPSAFRPLGLEPSHGHGRSADELDRWQLTSRASACRYRHPAVGTAQRAVAGARCDRFRSDWSRTHTTAIRWHQASDRPLWTSHGTALNSAGVGADGGSCTAVVTDRSDGKSPHRTRRHR